MSEYKLISNSLPDLLPMRDRSPGLHVSSIIKDLCIRLGHFDEQSELPITRLQLGQALEQTIATRFAQDDPDRYIQPGEIKLDGIWMTCDLIDTYDWVVEEIKLTWLSSKHGPDSDPFWKYWTQLKCYCNAWKCNVGRLRVVHIQGDYKGGDLPAPCYQVEWSEDELSEHWNWMLKQGERLENQD